MSGSGYADAVRWLKENGDEWVIQWAEAKLIAGPFVGAGTEEQVYVRLVPNSPPSRREIYGDRVELAGEGHTHLAAVQRAIGAYKA